VLKCENLCWQHSLRCSHLVFANKSLQTLSVCREKAPQAMHVTTYDQELNYDYPEGQFIRRISVASNAIQVTDNKFSLTLVSYAIYSSKISVFLVVCRVVELLYCNF